MKTANRIDAFTHHIIRNIGIDVLNSFSPKQMSAIQDAIRASQPHKKHSIDFRGAINLFFARYYFVIILGRDRRLSTQETELDRRQNAGLLGNIVFLIFVLAPFVLLIIISLYLLKAGLGIDLFPGKHMGGIFGL